MSDTRPIGADAGNTVNTSYVPIVFVPGFMGTCLELTPKRGAKKPWVNWGKWDSNSISTILRWVNLAPAEKRRLLDPDQTKAEIMKNVHGRDLVYHDAYFPFTFEFDRNLFNDARCPLHVLGYDWRQSPKDTAKRLEEKVNELTEDKKDKCDDVIVITHSMGGLVARWAFLQFPELASKVRAVIHVAQPVAGAPGAHRQLFSGAREDWGDGKRELTKIAGGSGKEFATIAAVLPGLIDLLPSPDYKLPDGKSWYVKNSVESTYSAVLPPEYAPGQQTYEEWKKAQAEREKAYEKQLHERFAPIAVEDSAIIDPALHYADESGDGLYYEPAHQDPSLKIPLKKLAEKTMANQKELGLFKHDKTWSFICTNHDTDIGTRINVHTNAEGKTEYKGHSPMQAKESGDGTVPTLSAAALFPDQHVPGTKLSNNPEKALESETRQYEFLTNNDHIDCMKDHEIQAALKILIGQLVKAGP